MQVEKLEKFFLADEQIRRWYRGCYFLDEIPNFDQKGIYLLLDIEKKGPRYGHFMCISREMTKKSSYLLL